MELIIPKTTVTVKEKEANRTVLLDQITCRDKADGDLTRAVLQSVSPSTPCFGCFSLEACGPPPVEGIRCMGHP